MIIIDIPGLKKFEIEHVVFDFNGTLTIDGNLIEGVRELLHDLSNQVTIHILTADTYGTSEQSHAGLPGKLEILTPSMQREQKESYILDLGKDHVIAIGNGSNDALMMLQAALSILVIQQEGACTSLFYTADIVCTSINDALNMILNPLRIVATLRK